MKPKAILSFFFVRKQTISMNNTIKDEPKTNRGDPQHGFFIFVFLLFFLALKSLPVGKAGGRGNAV